MHDTQNGKVFRQRIGPALVAEGVISVAQLKAALDRQDQFPYFTIGKIISILYNIPMEIIDDINVRAVVLPLFQPELLRRLARIVRNDRFAKDMDVTRCITDIQVRAVSYEVKNVESHIYAHVEANKESRQFRRYVQTEALVETVIFAFGGKAHGLLNAQHDTESKNLVITNDDDFIKTAIYYELRRRYTGQGQRASVE